MKREVGAARITQGSLRFSDFVNERQQRTIGTPLSSSAMRVLFLGSGELGKEITIELQRFGCEVIAVDRYANAPAMQVAHRSHVIDMLDGAALRSVIEREKPHLIVPEIEPIATLAHIEREGYREGKSNNVDRALVEPDIALRFFRQTASARPWPHGRLARAGLEYR